MEVIPEAWSWGGWEVGGEGHGGHLEGGRWQGGENGGVRGIGFDDIRPFGGRGEAGGEVGSQLEEGAGEPSYYSDLCWSSVVGGEGEAIIRIHVNHSLLPLAGGSYGFQPSWQIPPNSRWPPAPSSSPSSFFSPLSFLSSPRSQSIAAARGELAHSGQPELCQD